MHIIDSRFVWQGKWDVRVDTVALADGSTVTREIVVHPGSVVLIPMIDDQVVLIRQLRPILSTPLLELPAGTRDPDEELLLCAQRELREETGYRAGQLVKLAEMLPSPGSSTELMHFFLATDLTHDPLPMDVDETIENAPMRLDDAVELAMSGELLDMKSVAGLMLAMRHVQCSDQANLFAPTFE